MWTEYRGRAMGTAVQIVVPSGDEEVLAESARRLDDLENRWSRFLPRSELSRLNSHPGVPVIVSGETFDVVALAVDAWTATNGRFDPTIHDALVTIGYDRPFDQMSEVSAAGGESEPSPTPAGIVLDMALSAITLLVGVRLDLGGIGKGAAADLIVEEAKAAGGLGICINIGGDARVWGAGPTDGAWSVVLKCPGSHETRPIELVDGAVCTSTKLRRQWHNQAMPRPSPARSGHRPVGQQRCGIGRRGRRRRSPGRGPGHGRVPRRGGSGPGPPAPACGRGSDRHRRRPGSRRWPTGAVEHMIVNPPNPGRIADGIHRD